MESEIKIIVEQIIASDEELFLVDVKIKGNAGNQKVIVFIDGDKGLSIDQCGKVSKAISKEFEDKEFFGEKYTLEVSSPGLDHPITLPRQYPKNIGRELEVTLNNDEKIEGKLEDVKEDLITLSTKSEIKILEFVEIKQSKIKVSFK